MSEVEALLVEYPETWGEERFLDIDLSEVFTEGEEFAVEAIVGGRIEITVGESLEEITPDEARHIAGAFIQAAMVAEFEPPRKWEVGDLAVIRHTSRAVRPFPEGSLVRVVHVGGLSASTALVTTNDDRVDFKTGVCEWINLLDIIPA